MAGNRKAAMKVLVDQLSLLDKTGQNVEYYKKELGALSDAEFDQFINHVENGTVFISLVVENFRGKSLSVKELLEVGEKLGHEFFERIWLTDKSTGVTYLSVEKYLILDMMIRRQSQTLNAKISLAEDNNSVDTLSGQVTGDSKSSRLSFVELQILKNQGMDRAIEELIKPRGGDVKALTVLDKQIIDTGMGSLDAPGMDTGSVKSVDTLAALLTAAHLQNTFNK